VSDLDAALDAAIAKRTAEPVTETVEVLVGDEVWFLRFEEMYSGTWADICASSPIRVDAPLDRNYGYNFTVATEKAAPLSGVRLVDGVVETLTSEQWSKLFAVLSGHDRSSVQDAVFKLNEFDPAQRLARAKKALRVASKQKRPLHVS